MSYIDDNLVAGEQVIFRTRYHWYVIVRPIVGALLFIVMLALIAPFINAGAYLGTGSSMPNSRSLVLACVLPIAMLAVLASIFSYYFSEFGVTNRRVLIKTGVIRRQTLELGLGKVESFRIHESIMGRLLGFKTIILTGSGGTHQRFQFVNKAQEFRQVATQMGTQLTEQVAPATGYYSRPPSAHKPVAVPSRSLLDDADLPDQATQQGIQNAVALIRAGNTEQAKVVVQGLTQSAPNNADVWYLAGYLMTDLERKRAAYNRALSVDPAHKKAREGLASLG